MEQHSKETSEEKIRQEELFKMIEKIRNTSIQNKTNEEGASKDVTTEEMQDKSEETASNNSNNSIDKPAIKFKKYLGAMGVRYIQVGQASHVQEK